MENGEFEKDEDEDEKILSWAYLVKKLICLCSFFLLFPFLFCLTSGMKYEANVEILAWQIQDQLFLHPFLSMLQTQDELCW